MKQKIFVLCCQKNDSSYRHDQTYGNIFNLLPTNTVSTVPGTINYLDHDVGSSQKKQGRNHHHGPQKNVPA